MTDVTLSFDREIRGTSLGDFELFVDVSGASNITLNAPDGYIIKGVKMYLGSESQPSQRLTFTPNQQKVADKAQLNPPTDAKFQAVFGADGNSGLGTGFAITNLNTATATLSSTAGQGQGVYEYLVWLQSTADNTNDYADPGIRNKG